MAVPRKASIGSKRWAGMGAECRMSAQPQGEVLNPTPVPQPLPPAVIEALEKGRLVEAIKLLRASNIGLKEAKDLIENYTRGSQPPAFPPSVPGGPLPAAVVEAL